MGKRNKIENRVDNSTISVSNIMSISKRIPIQDIWPCEEYNFTPWLRDNIEELNKAIGIDLEVINIEQSTGRYELDMYAKDINSDAYYAIENQFGDSDNVHIGKAPMYAALLEAQNVIWIGERMLPEHKKYYEWLNAHTNAENHFYGVEIHCFDINGTKAYEFEVVVKPDNIIKSVNAMKSEVSEASKELREVRKNFFDVFKTKVNLPEYDFRTDERSYGYAWYNSLAKTCGQYSITIGAKNKTVRIDFHTTEASKYENLINDYLKKHNITDIVFTHHGSRNAEWAFWEYSAKYNDNPIEVADEIASVFNKLIIDMKQLN